MKFTGIMKYSKEVNLVIETHETIVMRKYKRQLILRKKHPFALPKSFQVFHSKLHGYVDIKLD